MGSGTGVRRVGVNEGMETTEEGGDIPALSYSSASL